jgi:hypothetical protein
LFCFSCKIQSRQRHGVSTEWGGDGEGDSDGRDRLGVHAKSVDGSHFVSSSKSLLFTIFFLFAMFDFWPILWMASLQCFFPPFFSYYTAIAVWPLLLDSIN